MLQVTRISPQDTELYEQECGLRERVLLKSAGYTIDRYRADYPYDETCEHWVAVTDHPSAGPTVLGCALLLPGHPDEKTGKVMQVAVNRQRQGEGIGRRLMIAVESRAFGELGLELLFCHAQVTAVPFYERLAWASVGEKFVEAGIDHFRMELRRSAIEAASDAVPDESSSPHGV
ncbi:MAG: GNAT family N-acetyltransferase [Planctomycetota bacterium]